MNIIKNILEISLLSSVLIVVVLALRTVWNGRLNYKVLSLLWILVLARLIIPFTIDSPIHLNSLIPEEEAETTTVTDSEAYVPNINTGETGPLYNMPTTETDSEALNSTISNFTDAEAVRISLLDKIVSLTNDVDLWLVAVFVWLCGAVFVLILNLTEYLQFSSLIKSDIHLHNPKLSAILHKYKAVLNIKVDISIFECKYVSTPVTFRCFRPIILMPRKMTRVINYKKLNMIVLHELCHIKRQDILKNSFWLFAKTIHWFNPLVWIAYKKYISDVELFCDDMVLKYIGEDDSFEYSQSLIDVIKLSNNTSKVPVALSFCEDKSKIKERVQNMIEPKKKLKSTSVICLIITLIMIIGCFTTACMKEDAVSAAQTNNNLTEQTSADNIAVNEPLNSAAVKETIPFNSSWVEVETEQKAVEIAKSVNISDSNADNFAYSELWPGVLPFHRVDVNDGTDTSYFIYDFNGECLYVSIEKNNNEVRATISESEAQEYAFGYIQSIYGNVDITIDSCTLTRDTFFIIKGSIYKQSEDSIRTIDMVVNGEGKFGSIRAEYDPFYVFGLGDELKQKVLSYSQVQNVNAILESIDVVDSKEIYSFTLDTVGDPTVNEQRLKMFSADYSLIEYTSNLGMSKEEFKLDDVEIYSLAQQYIDKYYPLYSAIKIENIEKAYSEAYVLVPIPSTDNYISMSIWADGSLKSIKIVEADTLNSGDGDVSAEEIETIESLIPGLGYSVLKSKEYEFVRKYTDMSAENVNVYEFQYTSSEPSIRDYSFVAQVYHDLENENHRAKINPVLDDLNILSEDEALAAARKIVSDKENIPESKLVCDYKRLETNEILTYVFDFLYDNTVYSIYIYPDTGLELSAEDGAAIR